MGRRNCRFLFRCPRWSDLAYVLLVVLNLSYQPPTTQLKALSLFLR